MGLDNVFSHQLGHNRYRESGGTRHGGKTGCVILIQAFKDFFHWLPVAGPDGPYSETTT